jgi:hypothetical protein
VIDDSTFAPAKPLFPGDTGTLALDTRLALCKLLQGPFIDAESPHWKAVLRDEAILRTRLSDVFLELMLDRERLVAFTRQAQTEDLDTPVLLRSLPLTFIESVLVLHLREKLIDAETRHERAVVDEEGLLEALSLFAEPSGDAVATRKRLNAAIEKMRRNNILTNIKGPERRMEISPALRLLFTANDVEELGRVYRKIAAGEPVIAGDFKESVDDEA